MITGSRREWLAKQRTWSARVTHASTRDTRHVPNRMAPSSDGRKEFWRSMSSERRSRTSCIARGMAVRSEVLNPIGDANPFPQIHEPETRECH